MGDKEVDSSLDESDFEDETIIERIIGLGEMFPDSMRNITFSLVNMTYTGLKVGFSISKSTLWFFASTSMICILPLLFELEIMQTEEQDAVQQRTMMLGPKAAGGSGLSGFSASIPHLVESK